MPARVVAIENLYIEIIKEKWQTFPTEFENRYKKHLYLCQKFQEHIQIIDHGLLVCRICENDYETQEKIF